MKPVRLTMQAFGSYGAKTVIDFEKPNQNLFLITGDTGAGKTTIFDALVFALYGEASSGVNKKSGTELQSQFVPLDTEPYVELLFRDGGDGDEYTVRRVPRHLRLLKRGSGVKDDPESVSLIMPDGTEYPSKETDRKLEEIVGLTKSQFMQVAMIAQGEFMDLLRAKSDDKKLIFRRLFKTELYGKIADEFSRRKKEKEKDIARIRTLCQSEASHLIVPDEYESAEAAREVIAKVRGGERLTVTDLETLLQEGEALCRWLAGKKQETEDVFAKAGAERDAARDQQTIAQNLLNLYNQADQAEKELEALKQEQEETERKKRLTRELEKAYECRTLYESLTEADRRCQETTRLKSQEEEKLPELEKQLTEEMAEEETARQEKEREMDAFSRTEDRVKKARDLFARISAAAAGAAKAEQDLKAAREADEAARKSLTLLEEQEKTWQKTVEENQDAERLLSECKQKQLETKGLLDDADAINKQETDLEEQQKKVELVRKSYAEARKNYEKARDKSEAGRQAYLDAQAGFLAQELHFGKPCPVCGSPIHPSPCKLRPEHRHLTMETLDALKKEAEELGAVQEKKAAEAKAAEELEAEKEKNLLGALKRFVVKAEAVLGTEEESGTVVQKEWMATDVFGALTQKERMGTDELGIMATEVRADENVAGAFAAEKPIDSKGPETLAEWKERFDTVFLRVLERKEEQKKEGMRIQAQKKTLVSARESLKNAGTEKENRKEAADHAAQAAKEAENNRTREATILSSLKEALEFPSLQEAEKILEAATARKKEKNRLYEAAHKKTEKTTDEKTRAKALIARYTAELPDLLHSREEKEKAYQSILTEKDMTQNEWMDLTKQHPRGDIEKYREAVVLWEKREAQAKSRLQAAREAIASRPRPDMETVSRRAAQAMEIWETAQKNRERYRAQYDTDNKAYEELARQQEERKKTVEEHNRLDMLYRVLSGNMSRARMDLETYVQRYYLERILKAANRRFAEMTGGQFELRMVNLEKAGEGKNHGLDLMVYSLVTGKEREVRTLSGGESFMAALSLALGMADQIQENSSAIHLDIMFIDEGFGSLDDHSREQAVRILKEMAGGSRQIGIISHVTELKQEMENQLIVSKGEDGSHVRWQIS